MSTNPYAAPKSSVADAPVPMAEGDFIAEGQATEIGRGWNWIAEGWGLFRKQPGMWILLLIILFAIYLALNFIPVVGQIAGLIYPVFTAGLMIGCHAQWHDEQLEVGHLFAGFSTRFGRLIGLSLLTFLVTLLIIFVSFGLVLGFGSLSALMSGQLLSPNMGITMLLAVLVALALILPLYMAIWFAPALIALNDFKAIQAMKTSFFACLKNILPFLFYGVVLFILSIVAAIPFGLGFLILFPVMIASIYASYRDIFYSA